MKATLKDISDHTGLSISTVSRILRGGSKSSSDNIKKTIHTAKKLNYPINSRLLNKQYEYKSKLQVAIISSFYPDEFYSSFFYGLDNSARSENIDLSFFIFKDEEDDLAETINTVSKYSFDAAILFIPTLQEEDYNELTIELPSGFSIISMAPIFNPILDTITFDSYRGGYLIAKHFHEKGYENLGIITGSNNKNEALLRKNGFTDYIYQNSELSLTWQFEGNYFFESGAKAFDAFTELDQKPRAIFASNDYMCLGFLENALKAGYEIPDDVAIAGYDDLPISNYFKPSITSVHTDYNILGKKTFNLLKEKINTPYEHSGILSIIPVSLTIRESS